MMEGIFNRIIIAAMGFAVCSRASISARDAGTSQSQSACITSSSPSGSRFLSVFMAGPPSTIVEFKYILQV